MKNDNLKEEESRGFKSFDSSLTSIERHRYSVTQGEYSISYNGKVISTAKGETNWGDKIKLDDSKGWVGYSDEKIMEHIERLYNNGDSINGIDPLKYDYRIAADKEPYIIFNKEKRDEHYIINIENEGEVYNFVANNLNNSKNWVYYSAEQLLKNHKEYCDKMGFDYEFNYAEDIVNNERGFQHILNEMDQEFAGIKEKGEMQHSLYGTVTKISSEELGNSLEQTKQNILKEVGFVNFSSEPAFSESNNSYFFHTQVENKKHEELRPVNLASDLESKVSIEDILAEQEASKAANKSATAGLKL